jgi:2-amino-4-hydroxy-6-hydroxymethyldihydropteridine diphosphokinase
VPQQSATTCLIGLGSNLGQRAQNLERAIELLAATRGVSDFRPSSWHRTRPIGGPLGQSEFLNGTARLQTTLSPRELLVVLQSIEHRLGRTPTRRWDARPLDLDLLLYGEQCLRDDSPPVPLEIPHPRMAFRRFVLEPAAEVAAEMIHPKIGWTIGQLLDHLRTAPPYIAIAAVDQSFATRLANAAARELKAEHRSQPRPALPAPGENSPDAIRQRAIEYLRQVQAGLPAAEAWTIDQVVIAHGYAPLELLQRASPTEIRLLMDAVRGELRHPKLLVVRDVSIQLPHSGPLLQISDMDFDAALEEVVAAIGAMKG